MDFIQCADAQGEDDAEGKPLLGEGNIGVEREESLDSQVR